MSNDSEIEDEDLPVIKPGQKKEQSEPESESNETSDQTESGTEDEPVQLGVGSVVELKSGSAPMTVMECNGDVRRCFYSLPDQKLQETRCHVDGLRDSTPAGGE